MISKHATLDKETIKLMKKLKVDPRTCDYCNGEYYPYKTETKEQWEKRQFCSSICKANQRTLKIK
jgi:hypothetical protein